MIEGFAFSDEVPYTRDTNIEKQRYERRGVRSAIAELGARNVQTQHVSADRIENETFVISGIVPPDADGERIRRILKQRGGKQFTSIPFITR